MQLHRPDDPHCSAGKHCDDKMGTKWAVRFFNFLMYIKVGAVLQSGIHFLDSSGSALAGKSDTAAAVVVAADDADVVSIHIYIYIERGGERET